MSEQILNVYFYIMILRCKNQSVTLLNNSTMKKLVLLCFLFVYSVALIAQSSQARINMKVKNMPLQEVLKEISRQAGVPISYNVSRLPVDAPVTVTIKNKTVEEALRMVCDPLKLTFSFVENQYVVQQKKEKETVVENPTQTQNFTFSGYIIDATSSEAIPGAVVYTSDLKFGTTSNGYGFFSLTIPAGNYLMYCGFLGYEKDSLNLELNKNISHRFKMEIDEIALKPIEIRIKEDSNRLVMNNKLGSDDHSPATLSRMPVFFSEPDVIKSMQFMPGIKNTIDGSSYYFVRGGERDQNLILLDDAPLYNPSHLFGFFTSINPETLTEIKLHKNDFPAYVGGKLSSVLELRTKEGNRNKFGMAGEWGLVTSRISAEGPMFKKKSSFYISARSSHIDGLAKKAMTNLHQFSFGDLQAKFNVSVNSRNRIYFSFFGGSDRFIRTDGNDKSGIQWGNFLSTFRWNRINNEKMFSNTIIYVSVYSYDLYQSYNTPTRWNSMIATSGYKHDYSYYKSHNVTHNFGIQGSIHNFNPGVIISSIDYSDYLPAIKSLTTGETNLYFSTSRTFKEKNLLRYGLRMTLYSNRGPAEYFMFDENYQVSDTIIIEKYGRYNTFLRFDPSVTYTRIINERKSLKCNYFMAHQYHQVLSNSISPFTSIEVWYPSTINVKPQAVHNVSAGYFHLLGKQHITFSAEVFGKVLLNQFDYQNQAALFLNPLIERELRFGNTKVAGFELMLRKETGKLQGWLGYAYTRAVKTVEEVNNGNPYPAYSDRPIDVSMFIKWQPGQRWLYTLGLVYASGMPYTTPTGYYEYMGYQVPVYSKKNNSRMPDYFRTDISAQRMLNKPGNKFKHYLTFSIYNLTNHKNPAFIHFNKIIDDNGAFVVPSNYANPSNLQPSQVILLGIIPSFKYNFHF